MTTTSNNETRPPFVIEVAHNGMITITDADRIRLNYCNILGSYKTESQQAVGLQTGTMDSDEEAKILSKCNEIAAASYELQEMLSNMKLSHPRQQS